MDYIWVEDYGAVGDGVTDDAPAIQAAINAAILSTTVKKVKFRPKNYKINSPIILYRLSGSDYTFFNLDLEGSVNANAGVGTRCTQLTCGHKDTFAIGLQNARSCTISNLLLVGGYSFTKTYKQICESDITAWAESGVRDSQFSPYSGIAVDPFGTSVPADGGYPGLSSYYKSSAGGSSGVSVRNCSINNFVVGYSISNNGTTPNAEAIHIYNSRVYSCKVAWSSGQSQTRGCVMDGVAVAGAMTVIDTVNYGAGTGSGPAVYNLILASVKNFVNILVNRDVFSARKVYSENLWKIGIITGNKQASFEDCIFKIEYGNGVKAPDSYVNGGGYVSFRGCDFVKTSGDQNFNTIFKNITVNFSDCTFEARQPGVSDTGKADYKKCTSFGIRLTEGGKYVGPTPIGHFNFNFVSLRKSEGRFSNTVTHTILPNELSFSSIGSFAITITSDSEATFTPSSVEKIKVGDIIYAVANLPYQFYFQDYTQSLSSTLSPDNTPVLGTVKSIVGGVVTIKDIPLTLQNATFELRNAWCDVYYGGIFGSTTSGSNVITNVYKESGNSLVGLRIYAADPTLFPFGLYVVSEDTNARTLTLSGNLNSTQSSIGLYTAYYTADIIVGAAPSTATNLYVEKGNLIRTRSQSLTDKLYLCSTGGIVGNGTHTPVFKEISVP